MFDSLPFHLAALFALLSPTWEVQGTQVIRVRFLTGTRFTVHALFVCHVYVCLGDAHDVQVPTEATALVCMCLRLLAAYETYHIN
jgi:hypothetical protein